MNPQSRRPASQRRRPGRRPASMKGRFAPINIVNKKEDENADFGKKDKIYVNANIENDKEKKVKYMYSTVDFSSDILEYLIDNNKFIIKPPEGTDKFYYLALQDSKLPILERTLIYNNGNQGFNRKNGHIGVVRFKNIFECNDFLKKATKAANAANAANAAKAAKAANAANAENATKATNASNAANLENAANAANAAKAANAEKTKKTYEEYKTCLSEIKKQYNRILKSLAKTEREKTLKSADKECLYDPSMSFPIPCETTYGTRVFKDDYLEFITYSYKLYVSLCEFITKYLKIKKYLKINNTPASNVDKDYFVGNELKPSIIFEMFDNPTNRNRKYIIVGRPSTKHARCNNEFRNLKGYDLILKKQIEQYEDLIKEYTRQELAGDPNAPKEIELCDFIVSKKKTFGNDYKYLLKSEILTDDQSEILTDDQLEKLKQFVREKAKKMCKGKFNKPNTSSLYVWNIMDVLFKDDGTVEIEYAFNSIREINSSHTVLLKRIEELSRTTMLVKCGIIREGESLNQVYSEVDLTKAFVIRSYYLHPLNYKIRYNYNENKIYTLEDLIVSSTLLCDGLGEGMADFKELPFLAVVPLYLTTFSYRLHSGIEMSKTPCYDSDLSKNQNSHTIKSSTPNPNEINETKFNPPMKSDPPLKSDHPRSIVDPSRSYAKTASTPPSQSEKNILQALFRTTNEITKSKLKVLSTIITYNNILFIVLYNANNGKFYYCMLEVNIKDTIGDRIFDISQATREGVSLIYLKPKLLVPMLKILIVKEFTKGNKVFSILGNECIYRMYSDMNAFFKQDTIQLTLPLPSPSSNLPSQIVEIPNIYGFMNPIIIDMIRTVKHFMKVKLDTPFEGDYKKVNIYYGKQKFNATNATNVTNATKKANEANATKKTNSNNYNSGNNTVKYYKKNSTTYSIEDYQGFDFHPLTNGKNVCISIGKKYIYILKQFEEDNLKTAYPTQKVSHKNFFKFTCWALTREYVNACLRIMKEYEKGKIPKNIPIPPDVKPNVLFNFLSIPANIEDITELNEHLRLHSQFVKDILISQDPNMCKSYEPIVSISPVSDVETMLLHFHFFLEIIHHNTLKYINYKKEFLNRSSSLYDDYSITKLHVLPFMNKFKTSIEYKTKSAHFNNPYAPSLKLNIILKQDL